MLPELDRSLRRLRARAKTAAWLEALARVGAPALFALGAWVLVARFALELPRTEAAGPLALVALVPLAAWALARRRFPSASAALLWLERASGGSGALVTHSDLGDARWSDAAGRALAQVERLPRVAPWRGQAPTLVGVAFVAGALSIERGALPPAPATQVVETRIEAAAEDLGALLEVVELEPDGARELEARLERLRQESDAAPLDASLEAADRTQEELARRAEEALAAAERARDGLDAAQAAQAVGDPEAALAALAEALRDLQQAGLAAKLPQELLAKLDPGSLELPEGAQLDPGELAQLSRALRAALDARMARLGEAGLLSKAALERFRELERYSEHVCDEGCKRGGT